MHPSSLCSNCFFDSLVVCQDVSVCTNCGHVSNEKKVLQHGTEVAEEFMKKTDEEVHLINVRKIFFAKKSKKKKPIDHGNCDPIDVDDRQPPKTDQIERIHVEDDGILPGDLVVSPPPCTHPYKIFTGERDLVCDSCGMVVAAGIQLFEYGVLEGAPTNYFRNSYKIRYYLNEKLAQWSGNCPKPSRNTMDKIVVEAKKEKTYGKPSGFDRKTIAKICRSVKHSQMQEKYPLIMKMLKDSDPVYFSDLPEVPIPPGDLINQVIDMFDRSLPAWIQCKDMFSIEEAEVSQHESEIPKKNRKNARLKKKQASDHLKKSLSVYAPKRHNFPHDFMIGKYLQTIERMDHNFYGVYDKHKATFKTVSPKVYKKHARIWQEMCRLMFSDNCLYE